MLGRRIILICFLTGLARALEESKEKKLDSKREQMLSHYFTEGVQSLKSDQIHRLFVEFFIGKYDEVMKVVKKTQTDEVSDVEHELYTSYMMLNEYLLNTQLDSKNKEELKELLKAKTVLDYSRQNSRKIMKKILENELDKKGITDQKERQKFIEKEMGPDPSAQSSGSINQETQQNVDL
jgi:hypothetical protein